MYLSLSGYAIALLIVFNAGIFLDTCILVQGFKTFTDFFSKTLDQIDAACQVALVFRLSF